jgi:replicative DNA helicase
MKITRDNFVWKLVTEDQAEFIFSLELFPLYALHSDESESLIETFDEIKTIFENGEKVGIEVGFIKNDKL